jgi:hypothetical protein
MHLSAAWGQLRWPATDPKQQNSRPAKVETPSACLSALFGQSSRSLPGVERPVDVLAAGPCNRAHAFSFLRGPRRGSLPARSERQRCLCSAAVGERPCYGRYQVCSHNLAQMRLDFLEFDPVAKNLDLIVNATQVVERPGGVLVQLPERPDPWSKIRTDPAPRPGTVRRFRFRS